MTNLDEISAAIGAMKQQHEESARQRSRIFKKLDDIAESQIELRGIIRELMSRQAEQEKQITEMQTAIEDYKRLKNRGLGVIAFIGFIAAGGGAYLSKFFSG